MSVASKVPSTTVVKDRGTSIMWIAAAVLILVFVGIPALPGLGDAAVTATGKAAADGAHRLGNGAYTLCKVGVPCLANANGLNRDPAATTPTTTPTTISDQEMAARQQAKATGDALGPLVMNPAVPKAGSGLPQLGGGGSTAGILGALPGPLGEAARTLSSGTALKALNP